METQFTPGLGLLGGALIGGAAALLWLSNGRIAGISGILARALVPVRGDFAWRIAFLSGLPLGAALVTLATGDLHGFAITPRVPLLVTAGLLVGFGTALGNGCTSGHGVCGVSRGSRRSIAATGVFLATGMLTVFLLRRGLGIA
jgi:uncharacterized membrane protein YedE/YeeE